MVEVERGELLNKRSGQQNKKEKQTEYIQKVKEAHEGVDKHVRHIKDIK